MGKLFFQLYLGVSKKGTADYSKHISLSPLSLVTDMTDATLRASGLWLETRTGAGGTTTLTKSFFLAAAHGSMDKVKNLLKIYRQALCIFKKYNFQEIGTGEYSIQIKILL